MVWIHGGELLVGSGSDKQWDGSLIAGNNIVVFLTINYRLAMFGFLPTGPDGQGGMNGVFDTVEALKWVQHRISHFGGDADIVTIVGESAGAVIVNALSVIPEAKSLFLRAIGMSSYSGYKSVEERGSDGEEMLVQRRTLQHKGSQVSYDGQDSESQKARRFGYIFLPYNPLDTSQEGQQVNPTNMILGTNTYDDPFAQASSKLFLSMKYAFLGTPLTWREKTINSFSLPNRQTTPNE